MRPPASSFTAVVLVALAACAPTPEQASPALWQVESPKGEQAFLFGTIHALERPALWRSVKVDAAMKASDRIVVEVSALADGARMTGIFKRLSTTPNLPPLSQRVAPALREQLEQLMARGGFREAQFAQTESWAAALMLARAGADGRDSEYGIDRAVLQAKEDKTVVELEGAEGQLGLFDTLPEKEQRDLLEAVIRDAGALETETADLSEAWRKGDIAAIERETHRGLLADPELRAALFTNRNRRWAEQIAAMMAAGEKPFVAVGTAHLAGSEGLPAMLEARGYKVVRVQ